MRDHQHGYLTAEKAAAFGGVCADLCGNIPFCKGGGQCLRQILKGRLPAVCAAEGPMGFSSKFFDIV